MEQTLSIRYVAANRESYESLAKFAVSLGTTVTLFPTLNTILITESSEKAVNEYINTNMLDFIAETLDFSDEQLESVADFITVDSGTLRRVIARLTDQRADMSTEIAEIKNQLADVKNQLADSRKSEAQYSKWWSEASVSNNRTKQQIKAIAILVNSIA